MQAEADMASPVYNSCVAAAKSEAPADGSGLPMTTLPLGTSRHLSSSTGVLGPKRSFIASMLIDPRGVQLATLKRASALR